MAGSTCSKTERLCCLWFLCCGR